MDPIKDFLEIVKLAKAQIHRNLVLFPLMAPESGEPDYLTLEEALREKAVVITEVSEGGHVPELKLINRSQSKILILEGEELKGAKQHRIVNATFLIGPKMEVVIPVSCVEHGRWSYQSRNFDFGEKVMHFSLRRAHQREVSKNLREENSFRSNQGMIWDGLAEKVERMKVDAPTAAGPTGNARLRGWLGNPGQGYMFDQEGKCHQNIKSAWATSFGRLLLGIGNSGRIRILSLGVLALIAQSHNRP